MTAPPDAAPPDTPARGPVTDSERSLAPDLARGAMLLLIALAYAPLYLSATAPGVLNHPEGGGPLDAAVRFAELLLLDNRAYPMFAALFGYGLAVLVARQRANGTPDKGVRRLLRRRHGYLLLFGLVHGVLVFPPEILGPYGLAGLLTAWLLLRSERAPLVAACVLAPVLAVLSVAYGLATATVLHADATGFSPGVLAEPLLARLFGYPFGLLSTLFGFPVPVMVLLGAWAGRRGMLDRPGEHRAALRRTAAVCLPVSVLGAVPLALVGAGLWQPEPAVTGLLSGVHVLTGAAGGLGYAALFGLVGARPGVERAAAARVLAAVGKRSLSCYLFLSLALALLLGPLGLGLGAYLHSAGAALAGAAVWAAGAALAWALERAGRRGPAEALLRRLVYRDAGRPVRPAPSPDRGRLTRALLMCGAVGAPLFVAAFLVQGAVRPGYDPLQQPVSSLALGPGGWVQTVNFLVWGVLAPAFAVGLRRALRPGPGSLWGPPLVAVHGVGIVLSGVFPGDPIGWYPPGTPPGPLAAVTPTGIAHDVVGVAAFVALVLACFVFARGSGWGWAVYAVASGLAFAGFIIAAGDYAHLGGLYQKLALGTGWAFFAVLAARTLRRPARES
ncbi:DUF998 domain-containing protein [Allonocardiopsis opalescens]|uniref:Putative membrane protein YeiB n=1 Tax=Allonocardiopsis opalescens TaxID=1144618 RepID=A0A2T0Q5S3_9ACTN|nr:DUF998 domain-containing protein [Allonocardiopsis opalescens]PRX99061.1 putative membrane protein YeiB [Allonocardiopsis opalescens]